MSDKKEPETNENDEKVSPVYSYYGPIGNYRPKESPPTLPLIVTLFFVSILFLLLFLTIK